MFKRLTPIYGVIDFEVLNNLRMKKKKGLVSLLLSLSGYIDFEKMGYIW